MSVEDQATLPAEGTAPATPEGEGQQVESEASHDAADTSESGDDSTTDSKDDAKAEVEKVRKQMQRRIDRLTARESAALQRAAAAEAAAEARAREAAGEDAVAKPRRSASDPEVMAAVRARDEATSIEKTMREAISKHPDFMAGIKELVDEIGGLLDREQQPVPLLRVAVKAKNAADVLHYLTKNTEVAAELSDLSEGEIGLRIAEISQELKAKATPKPSGAAKPLAPVKPSAPVAVDPSKLTDKQWAEMRRKERLSA